MTAFRFLTRQMQGYKVYNNWEEMLSDRHELFVPKAKSLDAAVAIYKGIYWYPNAQKNGVVAINVSEVRPMNFTSSGANCQFIGLPIALLKQIIILGTCLTQAEMRFLVFEFENCASYEIAH